MADTDHEAQWRKEFEMDGQLAVHDVVFNRHGYYDEPKKHFALRWLREKEKRRETRDNTAQWYSKWTFWAAVAAAVLALIGIVVSIRH